MIFFFGQNGKAVCYRVSHYSVIIVIATIPLPLDPIMIMMAYVLCGSLWWTSDGEKVLCWPTRHWVLHCTSSSPPSVFQIAVNNV